MHSLFAMKTEKSVSVPCGTIHNKKAFQSNAHRLLSDSPCFIVNRFEREVEVVQRDRSRSCTEGGGKGSAPVQGPHSQNSRIERQTRLKTLLSRTFVGGRELFVECDFFEKDLNVHMIQSFF